MTKFKYFISFTFSNSNEEITYQKKSDTLLNSKEDIKKELEKIYNEYINKIEEETTIIEEINID